MADEQEKSVERAEKQAFLKQEIIDQGFEPQDFVNYCSNEREPDIDLWTLDDLKKLVCEYKESIRQQELEEKQTAEAEAGEQVEQATDIDMKQRKPFQKKDLVIEIEDEMEEDAPEHLQDAHEEVKSKTRSSFIAPPKPIVSTKDFVPKYTIQGTIAPETDLSSNIFELKVTLSDPEIKKGGMFSSSYAEFEITTNPMGWKVKRQFNDFVWLRNTLATSFPDYIVPVLPKEVNQGSLHQELPKRKTYLQRFINAIIFTPIFQRSRFVVSFLLESNQQQWIAEKKLGAKAKKPTDISQIVTIDGEIPVNPENPPRPFMEAVQAFMTQTQIAGKKLKRSTGALMNDFQTLANSLKEIANQIRQLRDIHDLVPDSAPQKNMFNKVAQVMDQWSLIEKQQIKKVNLYLTTFFKFYYKQHPSILQLFKERESLFGPYKKATEKLKISKEKLWQSKSYKKWGYAPSEEEKLNKAAAIEKMLPEETNKVLKIEAMYGYYNYQAFHELGRKFEYDTKIQSAHFAEYSQVQQDALKKLTEMWQNLEQVMLIEAGEGEEL